MVTLTLKRTYQKYETIGILTGPNIKLCTVELRWNDNIQGDSCIPEGKYVVVPRNSPKHGDHFHITKVPGREFCLFHSANFAKELLGCIAPGLAHKDIDNDGNLDVTSSKLTMAQLLFRYPKGFLLNIVKA